MTIRIMVAAAVLTTGAPAIAQKTNGEAAMMRSLGGGLEGRKLAQAIAAAAAEPLGSMANPVRADGVAGQRAYLTRLRCADGTAPTFARLGSMGAGPFGYIVDAYQLTCPAAAAATIHIDMYHEHEEPAAAPGFTIIPASG